MDIKTLLQNVNRPLIVTLETEVIPDMVKRDRDTKEPNPYLGRVVKRSRVNGFIGFRYDNCVNNQRAREGNEEYFEALPRSWGQHIPGTPFVEHKGTVYLEVKVERALDTVYLLDGTPVSVQTIQPFLPVRQEGARQEVERPVVLRDYKLDNIIAVKVNGEEHRRQ